MPPKRSTRKAAAAPPAPPPLDGCNIALSGTFPNLSQSNVKDKAIALGAQVSSSVTASTTHLVTTQHDFLRNTTKVKAASAADLPIISIDWLLDCESNNKREAETSYSFSTPSSGSASAPAPAPAPAPASAKSQSQPKPQPQPAAAKSNGKTKRSAPIKADSDSDSDVKPQAKKAKNGAKGSANRTASKDTKTKAKQAKADKEDAADGQIAKSRNIQVPLDEACFMSGYSVYIDNLANIWDASLNQTNASNNNNKFYKIQIIRNASGDFKTWTRWGRVGERGQVACLGSGSEAGAIQQFQKKFKDKSGLTWENRNSPAIPGKYFFIERSYNADSDQEGDDEDKVDEGDDAENGKAKEKWVAPKSKLTEPVQELVKLIFNQQYFAAAMSELNYDANKLPLGKLSKSTITRGFQALKDLSALLDDNSLAESEYGMTTAQATEHLSNTYYSLIPHAFGRNRPPIIFENTLLKKEVELLESLSDMKDAALIMKTEKVQDSVHPLDKLYEGLKLDEMTALDQDESEFKLLKDYLNTTRGHTHGHTYKVHQIFRIERQGENERFDKQSPLAGPPRDRRLLWHGSRVTNFGGILSQGLRIAPPEAPVSGYMFGKGIYLADMSSKSANYCCSYISGGHALLLLCEAELGDPIQTLTGADYDAGEKAKKQGMFTTWGQGSTGPKAWKDAGCVHPSLAGTKIPDPSVMPGKTDVKDAYLLYNEYIVYDVSQVRLRYLLRVEM